MRKPFIGAVRRALFFTWFGGRWRWNAWVRDVTARMELRGWLRSAP
jgi:hypothetical protein